MPDIESVHHSYRLLTEGWLPAWAGLLVCLALAWVVWRHLRREFADSRPSRLSRWVLPVVRCLIVGLAVWLVCRPVFQVVATWQEKPHLLVLVDTSRSMRTVEAFGHESRRIDVLEVLDRTPLERRNRHGSGLARALDRVANLCRRASDDLDEQLADARAGLPIAPQTTRRVQGFAKSLAVEMEKLTLIQAPPPVPDTQSELYKKLASLATRRDALAALGAALVNDGDITAQEAPNRPEILAHFARRLKELTRQADALRQDAVGVQGLLDAALLAPETLARFARRRPTRDMLARQAAERIGTQSSRYFQTDSHAGDGLRECLARAFSRQLTDPLAGVVILSDGSGGIDPSGEAVARSLREMGVPIHTVLVGSDGMAPPDAGLVAVDMPSVAVRQDEVVARVLVKNDLDANTKTTLQVRAGDAVLATMPLPTGAGALRVIEVPLVFKQAGRQQLVFEVRTGGPDAYPGNERAVQTVDVLPDRARVLVVCDRLSDDFAAFRGTLRHMPFVELSTIVAEPEIAELEVGTKAGAFPGKADHWRGFSLAVLMGGIPDALLAKTGDPLGSAPLQGLRQAVENGLHVCIQDTDSVPAERAWASVFGLDTQPVDSPRTLRLIPATWPALYQLGKNEADSLTRWGQFPPAPCRTAHAQGGLPLLETDTGPVLMILTRGKGQVIYTGITRLASLRGRQTSPIASRLLAGILTLALRPARETIGQQRVVVFPPQPIVGKRLVLRGDGVEPATEQSGLRVVSEAEGIYRVADPERIALDVAGNRIERRVHRPLADADFRLTPHAEPLEQVSQPAGGRHVRLEELDAVPPTDPKPLGLHRRQVASYSLWRGWWPLFVLLVLVSAEYLLRRRAGRVM